MTDRLQEIRRRLSEGWDWAALSEEVITELLAELDQQREAVLAIHKPDADGCCVECSIESAQRYPCPTARAVGMTDQWGEVG